MRRRSGGYCEDIDGNELDLLVGTWLVARARRHADGLLVIAWDGTVLRGAWTGEHEQVGEQAMAALKTWRLLRKLRCSTTRITDIVKAVLTLQLAASA